MPWHSPFANERRDVLGYRTAIEYEQTHDSQSSLNAPITRSPGKVHATAWSLMR